MEEEVGSGFKSNWIMEMGVITSGSPLRVIKYCQLFGFQALGRLGQLGMGMLEPSLN